MISLLIITPQGEKLTQVVFMIHVSAIDDDATNYSSIGMKESDTDS